MSLLSIDGEHSATFLQGQLSCDIRQLENEQQFIAGAYCNHKGRVLANFFLWKQAASYRMLLHHGLLEAAQSSLNKYGVFSKVTTTQQEDEEVLLLSQAAFEKCLAVGEKETNDRGTTKTNIENVTCEIRDSFSRSLLIRDNLRFLYIDGEKPFVWCCGKKQALADFIKKITPQQTEDSHGGASEKDISFSVASPELEEYLQVKQSLALLRLSTSLLWTPAMFNWQQQGGVSFNKGCFVGQEVIARSENLGRLKRHLYRLTLKKKASTDHVSTSEDKTCDETIPQAGDALCNEKKETLGKIVSGFLQAEDEYQALAVIEDRALEGRSLKDNLCTQRKDSGETAWRLESSAHQIEKCN
jgi:tRNA-modifying protein YgfZ